MARTINLGASVEGKLKDLAHKIGSGSVSVGFMAGATYPNGTPVATVAFWNEFGTKGRIAEGIAPHPDAVAEGERREPQPSGGSPPRPFFRRMIAKESPAWSGDLGKALVATNNDGHKALALMGEEIQGQLIQSIVDLTEPPLAASTIRRKGFSKPLIDTSVMVKNPTYRVE